MSVSHAPSTAEASPSQPATLRLVIRAKIVPEGAPKTARPHSPRRALALVAGGVAVGIALLIWIGVSAFRIESPSSATANERIQNVESQLPVSSAPRESASAGSVESPQPFTEAASADAISTDAAKAVQLPALSEPEASPSPVNEVLPDAPRSALQTIRGTVRVSVRATIDNQGTVVAATSHDPGPSRYFERLALEASKKWTFAPADAEGPRTMLLRFNFTREGTSARATPLQ